MENNKTFLEEFPSVKNIPILVFFGCIIFFGFLWLLQQSRDNRTNETYTKIQNCITNKQNKFDWKTGQIYKTFNGSYILKGQENGRTTVTEVISGCHFSQKTSQETKLRELKDCMSNHNNFMRRIESAEIIKNTVEVGFCNEDPVQLKIDNETFWFPTPGSGKLVDK